jgi:hypothetical protein
VEQETAGETDKAFLIAKPMRKALSVFYGLLPFCCHGSETRGLETTTSPNIVKVRRHLSSAGRFSI